MKCNAILILCKVKFSNYFVLFCFSIVGITAAILTLAVSDVTADRQIALVFGFLISLLGMVNLIVVPLSGKLCDLTSSYDIVYSTYVGFYLAGGFLSIYFLMLFEKLQKQTDEVNTKKYSLNS